MGFRNVLAIELQVLVIGVRNAFVIELLSVAVLVMQFVDHILGRVLLSVP